MQLVPVIALVDPAALDELRPSLDAIAGRIVLNDDQRAAGWTPDALALGVILRKFADDYMVVDTGATA